MRWVRGTWAAVALLAALALPATTACGKRTDYLRTLNLLTLTDDSRSGNGLPGGQPDPRPGARELITAWIREDSPAPGSCFEGWRFTPADSALEIERPCRVAVLEPKPPVRFWREDLEASALQNVEAVLTDRGGDAPAWTPLFEGSWRLMERGSTLPGDYVIAFLKTDLLQTSPFMTLNRRFLDLHSDEDVLRRVGERLPAPGRPPLRVLVYYHPGVADGTPVTGSFEERLKRLFKRIFQEVWKAPEPEFRALR